MESDSHKNICKLSNSFYKSTHSLWRIFTINNFFSLSSKVGPNHCSWDHKCSSSIHQVLPPKIKYRVKRVGHRGLIDRASASYPHGAKGLGFNPLWRQKLYNCNLYLLMKYRHIQSIPPHCTCIIVNGFSWFQNKESPHPSFSQHSAVKTIDTPVEKNNIECMKRPTGDYFILFNLRAFVLSY